MNFLKTLILVTLFATSAQAGQVLLCENGDINTMGDSHRSYQVSEDRIVFTGWEWGYEVQANDIVYSGKTAVIQNKAIEYYAEGDVYNQVLNAMLVLSEDSQTLHVSTSFDSGSFRTESIDCVVQN